MPDQHTVCHNDTMRRTTVMADDLTLERLKSLARDRGVSLGQIIREALNEKAAQYRPKPHSVGIASSRRGRVSETTATERVPPRSWR
jgi:predicted transcriptional regulator